MPVKHRLPRARARDGAEAREALAAVRHLALHAGETQDLGHGGDGLVRRVPVPLADRAVVQREARVSPADFRGGPGVPLEEARDRVDAEADRRPVAGDERGDADADHPRRPAQERHAHREPGERAAAPGRHDDDVGPRDLPAPHLLADLEHRVDVAEARQRAGGAGEDQVRPLRAPVGEEGADRGRPVPAAVHHVPPGRRVREHRGARERGDRLVEEHRVDREAEAPPEEDRRHDLRRREPAHRDQRPRAALLGVGEEELEAAHLVAAVERRHAVVALVEHAVPPDPRRDARLGGRRSVDDRPPRHRAAEPRERVEEGGLAALREDRGERSARRAHIGHARAAAWRPSRGSPSSTSSSDCACSRLPRTSGSSR